MINNFRISKKNLSKKELHIPLKMRKKYLIK
jgi:hypothetical protein